MVKGEIVSTVTTTAESTAPGETVFTTEADPIPKNQESKLFRTLNWVLSSRLAYSTSINAQFREDMPRSLLFGVGYRQLPSYTYSVQKAVEMDYISVFYRNGRRADSVRLRGCGPSLLHKRPSPSSRPAFLA